VLAAAAYLNQHQMLPQQRSAELLGEMCDLPMSAATVQMATLRVQGQVTPVVLAIRQALLDVPVLNADESGLRVNKLLQWLHVACTDTLVWMARHVQCPPPARTSLPGRGTQAKLGQGDDRLAAPGLS
jgi:transposase